MRDILLLAPVGIGAVMIALLFLELALGKIGFTGKGLGATYDPAAKRWTLSTGSVTGVFLIGAGLAIAPLVIDYFLVAKKAFFVSGQVKIEGEDDASGVKLISCYPLTPVDSEGYFVDAKVFKDSTGYFPKLAFEYSGYYTPPVNLNVVKANKMGSHIELFDAVELKKKDND